MVVVGVWFVSRSGTVGCNRGRGRASDSINIKRILAII